MHTITNQLTSTSTLALTINPNLHQCQFDICIVLILKIYVEKLIVVPIEASLKDESNAHISCDVLCVV